MIYFPSGAFKDLPHGEMTFLKQTSDRIDGELCNVATFINMLTTAPRNVIYERSKETVVRDFLTHAGGFVHAELPIMGVSYWLVDDDTMTLARMTLPARNFQI